MTKKTTYKYPYEDFDDHDDKTPGSSSSSLKEEYKSKNWWEEERDLFGRKKSDAYTSKSGYRWNDWDRGYTRGNYSNFFTTNWGKNKNYETLKMIKSMFSVMQLEPTQYKFIPESVLAVKRKGSGYEDHVQTLHDKDVNLKSEMVNELKFLHSSHASSISAYKSIAAPMHLLDSSSTDAFYGSSILNAGAFKYLNRHDYVDFLRKKYVQIQAEKDEVIVNNYLTSVLTEEYVQQQLASSYPGYLKFVQSYKDELEKINKTKYEVPLEMERSAFLVVLSKILQYPSLLTEEESEHFKDAIEDVKNVLKEHGVDALNDYGFCKHIAQELTNIAMRFQDPPQKGEGDGEDEDKDKDSDLNDLIDKLANLEDIRGKSKNIISQLEDIQDFSKKQLEKEKLEKLMIPDMHEMVDDELVYFHKVKKDGDVFDLRKRYHDLFRSSKCNNLGYLKRLFERINKDYKYHLKGMRSGRLDTNKLAEARQHVETVYERMAHVKTNKVTVGVLIDESGSMSGSSIRNAQKATIIINEIFKNNSNIELFIYGHTADDRDCIHGNVGGIKPQTLIRVYKEPGLKFADENLTQIEARSNNKDGTAIYACAKRIRRFTQNNGFLFVISDGQPHASGYGGQPAIKDVKEKVEKCAKMNLDCIQIAIAGYDGSHEMFKHVVKFSSIENLGTDLANFMSKKIITKLKNTVSIN